MNVAGIGCSKQRISTAPDQVVISAMLTRSNRALQATQKERRTRAVLLPVSSAFHTPLMESAREALNPG